MGVYIPGIEMPKSCYYCPFADGSWGYSPPHKKRCLISGKDMPVDARYVQHNQSVCPLAPAPDIIQVDLGVFIEGKVKTFDIPNPKEKQS